MLSLCAKCIGQGLPVFILIICRLPESVTLHTAERSFWHNYAARFSPPGREACKKQASPCDACSLTCSH